MISKKKKCKSKNRILFEKITPVPTGLFPLNVGFILSTPTNNCFFKTLKNKNYSKQKKSQSHGLTFIRINYKIRFSFFSFLQLEIVHYLKSNDNPEN